jgi:peptide/nickel transport system substrate-binding protein
MKFFNPIVQSAKAAVIAAAILASPNLASAAPPAQLTVALTGDFPGLDPSKDTSPLGFNYRLNVFDALTELQRDGEMNPRLAESWSSSDDLTQWTFKLRKGVKFHDGSPFTADDVVFTITRVLNDSKTPLRTFVKLVKTVEKVDDHTVKFTLIQPYSIFYRQISYVNIMSKAYWEKVGDEGYAKKPVGTGPYKFVEWVKDDRMVLEANEGYWRGAPAIKKAILRPIPSEPSRVSALLSGEIDLVPSLPPSLLPQVKAAPNLNAGIAPSFRTIFIAFTNKPPFDKPKIREAIDVAIDRKSITEKLLRGLGEPAGSMVPPMDIGFDPSLKPVAYDPERAKALVKEAGYKGEVISIQYPSNNIVMANEVVQAIAGYMTAAGLKVEIRPLEFTAFFPLWLQSRIDSMYFFAFGSSQYHGETVLTTMYEKGANAQWDVDMEIDRLLKAQRAEKDPAKQKQMLSQAFRLSNEDRYHLPIYHEMQAFGVKKTIDYKPWPDGFVRLYDFK